MTREAEAARIAKTLSENCMFATELSRTRGSSVYRTIETVVG